MKRKTYDILPLYSFKEEDDWGDYYKGEYRNGVIHSAGYRLHWYNCTDGKRHRFYEHVIKWEYFNGKIPEGYEIDHIIPISNGGTNKLSNLRCVSHKDNLNNSNSFANRSNSHKGKKPWNKGIRWDEEVKKKISEAKNKTEIVQISNGVAVFYNGLHEAERKTGICHNNIARCCNGGFFSKKRNKWVNVLQAGGFKWMYKEDYTKMLEDLASQQLN
jgi:hypothetical protein